MKNPIERECLERRYAEIRREIEQQKADLASWNENHPDEEPIVINFDFTEELKGTNRS